MDNVPIDPDSDRPSLAAHSTLWWSLGLAAFGALLALAYPTVRDNSELDKTFAGLPPVYRRRSPAPHSEVGTRPEGGFASVTGYVLLVTAFFIAVSTAPHHDGSASRPEETKAAGLPDGAGRPV